MFDINNYPDILNHLKYISKVYNDKSKTAIVVFCPYCDDEYRRPNPDHGHLNIGVNIPTYHCFRCETSGSLSKLLIDTEYSNTNIIKELNKNIKYKANKDYYKLPSIKKYKYNIIDNISNTNSNFYINDNINFNKYKLYLNDRIGSDINFRNFLITPGYIFGKNLCCNFYNVDEELITSRLIDNYKNIRYHNNPNTSGLYYFQQLDFEQYNNIILCEGVFDIINLYLYNNSAVQKNIYISISGKKYFSAIDRLIFKYLLIGDYNFDIIFDADVLNYKKYIYKINKLIKGLNNISISYWSPIISKDTGKYPLIERVFK